MNDQCVKNVSASLEDIPSSALTIWTHACWGEMIMRGVTRRTYKQSEINATATLILAARYVGEPDNAFVLGNPIRYFAEGLSVANAVSAAFRNQDAAP